MTGLQHVRFEHILFADDTTLMHERREAAEAERTVVQGLLFFEEEINAGKTEHA